MKYYFITCSPMMIPCGLKDVGMFIINISGRTCILLVEYCNCNLFAVLRSSTGYNPMDIDIVIIHNIFQYSTIHLLLGLLAVKY
jgi:hypothetical protein